MIIPYIVVLHHEHRPVYSSLPCLRSSLSGVQLGCMMVPSSKTGYWCHTIQYNERFVRRRFTNRRGAPYNNNNKSVCTIKHNSFKSFLECVSVSNAMQVRWQSVPGGRTRVVETTFAKLGACSQQYVVSRVTRSESVPVPAMQSSPRLRRQQQTGYNEC